MHELVAPRENVVGLRLDQIHDHSTQHERSVLLDLNQHGLLEVLRDLADKLLLVEPILLDQAIDVRVERFSHVGDVEGWGVAGVGDPRKVLVILHDHAVTRLYVSFEAGGGGASLE